MLPDADRGMPRWGVAPNHGPGTRIGIGAPLAVAQPQAVQRLAEPGFRTTWRHFPAQAPRRRIHTSGSATGSAERRSNLDSGKAARTPCRMDVDPGRSYGPQVTRERSGTRGNGLWAEHGRTPVAHHSQRPADWTCPAFTNGWFLGSMASEWSASPWRRGAAAGSHPRSGGGSPGVRTRVGKRSAAARSRAGRFWSRAGAVDCVEPGLPPGLLLQRHALLHGGLQSSVLVEDLDRALDGPATSLTCVGGAATFTRCIPVQISANPYARPASCSRTGGASIGFLSVTRGWPSAKLSRTCTSAGVPRSRCKRSSLAMPTRTRMHSAEPSPTCRRLGEPGNDGLGILRNLRRLCVRRDATWIPPKGTGVDLARRVADRTDGRWRYQHRMAGGPVGPGRCDDHELGHATDGATPGGSYSHDPATRSLTEARKNGASVDESRRIAEEAYPSRLNQ